MDNQIIVRSVARPADGHYCTLKEARKAAKWRASACILFDPSRGYLVSIRFRHGYELITFKENNGKWSRRNDTLPNRVRSNR